MNCPMSVSGKGASSAFTNEEPEGGCLGCARRHRSGVSVERRTQSSQTGAEHESFRVVVSRGAFCRNQCAARATQMPSPRTGGSRSSKQERPKSAKEKPVYSLQKADWAV